MAVRRRKPEARVTPRPTAQSPRRVMPHAPTARRKPQPTHAARECQQCRPSALRHPPPCTAAPHQPRPPLLKLRPVGTGCARASDPHRLRATSAPIGLVCCAPFSRRASFTASASLSCGLRLAACNKMPHIIYWNPLKIHINH